MKTLNLFQYLTLALFLLYSVSASAQYEFPECMTAWDATQSHYVEGAQVSHGGVNYQAKYWTSAEPPHESWQVLSKCGDGGLGNDWQGAQRVVGYLPYWVGDDFDLATDFDPSRVTHVNLSFILFQQNNNDFNSADFASIAWAPFHKQKIDSLIVDLDIVNRAHSVGTKVSVAVGGATDFAFLWLMAKYWNNDAKIDEMATLITNYVTQMNLDGVDLDLECWWADPSITGTTEIGGRVRGDKWGGTDQGPHEAGIGLTKLAQKLREKMPNKIISAAVFGTSYYGNNYDDSMYQYLDWIGLMTYDFTGSWDKSPKGPHSSLYKVPLNTYPGQSADQPIYSAQDALEYWMGLAEPAWNHDGGFSVPKAKLMAGVPFYGYDFSQTKPDGGNGYLAVRYKDIIADYPNAATTFDPNDTSNLGGYIAEDGRSIYYNTPKGAAAKVAYSKQYGHQGVIIWELTQDVEYTSSSSILKAINDAVGNDNPVNNPPVVNVTSPQDGASYLVNTEIALTANASDDSKVIGVEFKINDNSLGTVTQSPYTLNWTPTAIGSYKITAVAQDDSLATTTSQEVTVTVSEQVLTPPTVAITSPAVNTSFTVGNSITIEADANDSDGNVTKVDFYAGSTLLGTDETFPYSYAWTNAAVGSYDLKAIATDNDQLTTTSVLVPIAVQGVSTCTAPAWDAAATYVKDDIVSYNGHEWKAKWWTQNEVPDPVNAWGVWEDLGECSAQRAMAVVEQLTFEPNPFANTIRFNVVLGKESRVALKITSMNGLPVTTLVNQTLSAGEYSFTYDGSELLPGFYVYTLETDGEVKTGMIEKR